MRILEMRLQDFRNVTFASIDLSANRCFLLGSNGQGKSNYLEAVGLLSALRSFRTQSTAVLPRRGQKEFSIFYRVEMMDAGESEIIVRFGDGVRRVEVDGEPVSRMRDFIGRYPVVALSSDDLMLLRGSPAERRRLIDLTLATLDPEYYSAVKYYHRSVAGRNRLLKQGASAPELSAFELEIAKHGIKVIAFRVGVMARIREHLKTIYAGIAEGTEGADFTYQPNVESDDIESYRALLQANRQRDSIIGTTQRGPHRDDFKLTFDVGRAKEYASDGQQRGFCVALRLAQSALYVERLGIEPLLLVDDVLGELDTVRREGFWKVCPESMQVIASGTELPTGYRAQNWTIYSIENGQAEQRIDD